MTIMEWPHIDWPRVEFLGFGWVQLVLLLIVAGLVGGAARIITGQTRGGCFASVVWGLIGVVVALLVHRYTPLPEIAVLRIGDLQFPVVWSIIVAAVFITLITWLLRPRKPAT